MTELCIKCKKNPCYQRGETTFKLCAECALLAITDFIIEPSLGDTATCKLCGGTIEYIGPYWRHTDKSPRHIATPSEQYGWLDEGTRELARYLKGEQSETT